MIQQDSIKSYFKGVVIAALLLATVMWASTIGAQQGTDNPNASGVAESDGSAGTDDLLGRNHVPAGDEPTFDGETNPNHTIDWVEEVDPAGQRLEGQSGPESNPAVYDSPLVIPAADFRSDGLNPDGYYFLFSRGSIEGDTAFPCMMAPAYLPEGAEVFEMWASVIDNAANNITVILRRVDNYNGNMDIMASTSSSGTSTSITSISDLTIDFPLVEYPTYSYYVTTCVPDTVELYSVRLWYNN